MTLQILEWAPSLRQAPRAGIYRGSMAQYLATAGVSRTALFRLDQTPAHYLQPDSGGLESEALAVGTAFHTLILEPEKAGAEIEVAPADMTRRQNVWADCASRASARGAVLVTRNEANTLSAMRSRVLAEPGIEVLLASTYRELIIVWQDAATGIWCKARLDLLDLGPTPYILDLKTTSDASERSFAYSCRDYGYTLQAGMYLEGINALLGPDAVKGFIIIACEKDAPYRLEWYDMRRHVEVGRKMFHELLGILCTCQRHNQWPAMKRVPGAPITIHELPVL